MVLPTVAANLIRCCAVVLVGVWTHFFHGLGNVQGWGVEDD